MAPSPLYDADSHVMELSDWLVAHADPDLRDRLRPLALGGAGKLADQAVTAAESRRGDEAAATRLEEQVWTEKGWAALGAFDPAERSRALDLMGVDAQLVFSTFAATQFTGDDVTLAYGGARAHNRAMAAFCADDPRLLAVGLVGFGVPEMTVAVAAEAIDEGCAAILVPSAAPRGVSPTHPDYDPFWRLLAERDVPFMVHIGGGGRPVAPAFHDNGRPVTDFLGGGENIRSKDYAAIHHPPEIFLSCLVLDGVLDRFPTLRGGCIEMGAMWVVPWLRRLDLAQSTFRRTEPTLAELSLPASEYVRRQLRFTPFPTEPVGWIVEQAGPELVLFSTDYPHPEGGRDPLGRFGASVADLSDDDRDRFYHRNFADLMGSQLPVTGVSAG